MSLRFQVSAAPDAVFVELCARARAAHPRIQPDDRAFIAHMRMHAADLPPDRIDSMRVDDLYLAWACARGDVGAQRQLETLLAQVPAALARIDRSETFAQDVQQQLREKLLVGTGETGPKLMQYAGRGPLGGWIRTAALRTALNMRGGPRDQRLDDRDLAHHVDMPDPHTDLVRERYKEDFERAVRDAFRYLTARERNVLRLSYIDGLSIDRIGVLFGVHRATTARWLQRAREKLHDGTRRLIQERLGVTDSELQSLIRAVHSQIQLSLPHLLRSRTYPPSSDS